MTAMTGVAWALPWGRPLTEADLRPCETWVASAPYDVTISPGDLAR